MDQPIRPFRTISLEERLKQSKIQSPVAASLTTDKTSPVTKKQEEQPSKIAAQLKLIGDAQEKNAAILKQMIGTIKKPEFPNIGKYASVDLSEENAQRVNTSFPKTIRLDNRLLQPLDSRTTHLAKFFVSDSYSGIVKATPFTTSPLASRVNIDPFGLANKKPSTFYQAPDPNKGSPRLGQAVTPLVPTDTQSDFILTSRIIDPTSNLFAQGATLFKDNVVSVVDVDSPLSRATILVRQGTTLSNEVFSSVTVTRSSILPELLTQGGVESKKTKGITTNAVLQGLVLDQGEIDSSFIKLEAIDPIPIAIRGIPRFPAPPKIFELPRPQVKQATSPAVNDTGQPLQPTTSYQLFAPILQNALSDLAVLKKELAGYGSVALPFNYSPAPYYRPTLQLAGYEADRLLAIFSPAIKHGSVAPSSSKPSTAFNQGQVNIPGDKTPPTQQFGPNKPFQNTGGKFKPDTITQQAGKRPAPEVYQASQGFGNVNEGLWSSIAQALANGSDPGVASLVNFPKSGQGSLSTYTAISYGAISGKRAAADGNAGLSATAAPGKNPQIGKGNGGVQNVPDLGAKDFITLSISSERGGSVKFKAYLTSFSDSFSTSWNDIQYVGRQDTFKQFKGVTRSFSFGISVPSFSKVDLPINMGNIQKAVQITQMAAFNGPYLKGPLCRINLGGFFKNAPCVFSSVKIDFDPAESTWDIDSGLPHLVKMSFDGTMLGTVDGKGMSDTGKVYSFG